MVRNRPTAPMMARTTSPLSEAHTVEHAVAPALAVPRASAAWAAVSSTSATVEMVVVCRSIGQANHAARTTSTMIVGEAQQDHVGMARVRPERLLHRRGGGRRADGRSSSTGARQALVQDGGDHGGEHGGEGLGVDDQAAGGLRSGQLPRCSVAHHGDHRCADRCRHIGSGHRVAVGQHAPIGRRDLDDRRHDRSNRGCDLHDRRHDRGDRGCDLDDRRHDRSNRGRDLDDRRHDRSNRGCDLHDRRHDRSNRRRDQFRSAAFCGLDRRRRSVDSRRGRLGNHHRCSTMRRLHRGGRLGPSLLELGIESPATLVQEGFEPRPQLLARGVSLLRGGSLLARRTQLQRQQCDPRPGR